MSCCLCRLPFTPSTHSVAPRWPPPGVLSDKQIQYMKHAFGMGLHVCGLAIDLVYMDANNFIINNSPVVVNIVWETDGKTFIVFHPHCATILRHQLGYPDNTPHNLIELAVLELIIGPTMDGLHAGRLRGLNYEGIFGEDDRDRVDIESLWSKKGGDCPDFDWLEWQRRGLDWTAARPDIFPRFRPKVACARTSSLGPFPAELTEDVVTTLPLDILDVLLPYLDNKSFVNLLSTCRILRYQALSTFQSHSRTRVLQLRWAVPTEVEYAGFVKRNPPPRSVTSSPTTPTSPVGDTPAASSKNAADLSLVAMVHAKHSPIDADWYLYLSQVHRTQGMRARRWMWALAEEFTRVYRKKRAEGPFEDVVDADGKRTKGPAWAKYTDMLRQQLDMRKMLTAATGPNGKAMSW